MTALTTAEPHAHARDVIPSHNNATFIGKAKKSPMTISES